MTRIRFWRRILPVLFILIAVGGCRRHVDTAADSKAADEVWFEDRTAAAGIDFVHVRTTQLRYWLPEITSGGAAWIDHDADGDLDLYLVQGGQLDPNAPPGPGNVLYENQGDGSFRDVTDQAGVGDRHYGMGAAVADVDGDGLEDLYVTNVGPNVLYRNRGDGSFVDVTDASGVGDDGWSSSAAFADYDADGDLDLFVVNYVRWSPAVEIECRNGANELDYCDPAAYQAPAVDRLYRNRGDGTFDDVSQAAGITAAAGNGLGITAADFNLDGRLDYYVANDGNPNQLWIQDAAGHFQDRALLSGCAVNRMGAAEAGMGVATVDIDNDGDLDLFMSHLVDESNTLYVNQGGQFDDVTAMHGLSGPSISYTGFGLGFADFDHDGHVDLYVANGRVSKGLSPLVEGDPFAEPNQLFQGQGTGRFVEVMPRGGTRPPQLETSRAAVLGDYNADGSLDLLVLNSGGRPRLLANRIGAKGAWIRFRVLDSRGGDALGARVRIETADGIQWRPVQRAYGYLSSHEPHVHFGLGRADRVGADRVTQTTVFWLDGSSESFGALRPNQLHQLRRGHGESRASH